MKRAKQQQERKDKTHTDKWKGKKLEIQTITKKSNRSKRNKKKRETQTLAKDREGREEKKWKPKD